MTDQEFQDLVADRGRELFRPMPWRENTDPYYILVSELMLQQTQVDRVIPKFQQFIEAFPAVDSLATADLSIVLTHWQGLGYNRRARYLHQAAKKVVDEFAGNFPSSVQVLKGLPGVGSNTAAAIAVYAFNAPAVFVETNIRTVYIHHFFADNFAVVDTEIQEKLEHTLNRQDPRHFYWAIMDYGAYLKKSGVKAHTQSRHYSRQSKLEGSLRQMRGQILKRLTEGRDLVELMDDSRFQPAVAGLVKDGLVEYNQEKLHLAK